VTSHSATRGTPRPGSTGKRYPVGKVFTVNPDRGVPRVAECEVTARYRQVLGTVDARNAAAEGFKSQLAFRDAWTKINGSFHLRETVDVVEFKLIGPDCMGCDGCGWCEGSAAWTCADCFGTGIEVSPAAKALIAKVEGV